jgi:hypothetical protein
VIRTRVTIGVLLCAASLAGVGSTSARSPEPEDGNLASPAASGSADALQTLTGRVLGGGSYPAYTVEVSDHWWTDHGYFLVRDGPAVMGVSVWDVGQVPRDPCRWSDSLDDPGPSVDDLVEALVAQAQRDASPPVAVTLGGYSGRYLEWSVPADAIVSGDGDFAGCDPQDEHLDFVSWLGDGFGERWQQVAGQVDRLWVLDVAGQRLVVDATYSPDASEEQRAELEQVVESIRFAPAAG